MPWRRQTAPRPKPARNPDPVSPELLAWANALDATLLSEKTAQDAERFLQTYRRMPLSTRREIAYRLRSAIEDQISPTPPPTVGSMDVIATVLSARRNLLG
jgi:acyl-CoA reductase-like NAD-dependent aldehyde dehydrogenase